jgi:F0F1-type ATP synthase assembly protein I
MKNSRKHIKIMYRLVMVQSVMGLLAAIIIAVHTRSMNALLSGIVGLFIALISTLIGAKIAFGDSLVVAPNVAYARHKKAMISRFILNLLLFAVVVLVYRQCNYIALLSAYIAALSGYWISLIIT